MRILFVSDTYYPHLNGVYYFVCRLAPLLQEKGHQVAVIAPSETIYSSLKEIDNIDEELLKILAKRMDIVREIGKIKKENLFKTSFKETRY